MRQHPPALGHDGRRDLVQDRPRGEHHHPRLDGVGLVAGSDRLPARPRVFQRHPVRDQELGDLGRQKTASRCQRTNRVYGFPICCRALRLVCEADRAGRRPVDRQPRHPHSDLHAELRPEHQQAPVQPVGPEDPVVAALSGDAHGLEGELGPEPMGGVAAGFG